MKKMLRRTALSGATIALLAAAVLQVAEPTDVRAQEDECPGYGTICRVDHTVECRFWIFFCKIVQSDYHYWASY